MRIEVVKNFIDQDLCEQMNSWVDLGVDNKWLDMGISRVSNQDFQSVENRFTSRFYGHRFVYPDFVLDLSQQIRKFCGIDNFPLIEGHGRNGIVVSCTLSGGDVYKHRDSYAPFQNKSTLRCNIMTRAAESGGKLFVGNNQGDIDVGDLHCYLASDFDHYVTTVEGNTSRVLWMFGAHVPFDDWESGKIKLSNSK